MATDIQALAQQIRNLETGFGAADRRLFLRLPFLEPLLPEPEIRPGALIELVGEEGAGLWTIGLLIGREGCGRRALIVLDSQESFYPPGLVRWGIDLNLTFVIRPRSPRWMYSTMNRVLRCPAVGAVLGWCETIKPADYQRLRLAAEEGQSLGVVLRPSGALVERCFANFRFQLTPLPSRERSRRIQIELLRGPGGLRGRSFVLEVDDEKGDVRLPARLAAAETVARPATLAQ
ncbi:MAG: hypothetical protein U0793_10830 [Gemmataceae bacterium]